MRRSHVRNFESPRKLPIDRKERTKTSCATSSASERFVSKQVRNQTNQRWCSSTRRRKATCASLPPCCTAAMSLRSSSSSLRPPDSTLLVKRRHAWHSHCCARRAILGGWITMESNTLFLIHI